MACDICGKVGIETVTLLDSYQTNTIKVICPECEKVVNSHLSKVRSVTHNILCDLMKRFMANRKEQGK